tara:strand:- start:19978 stop:20103 length:126 start_codon:yes stop_codon:yes gene_type:complete
MFQFQIGAIKGMFLERLKKDKAKFQFQIGAIKGKLREAIAD